MALPKPALPTIAFTIGDPAGVGPEIIAAAWKSPAMQAICRPFVVGHAELMRRAVAVVGGGIEVVAVSSPAEARPSAGTLPCLEVCGDEVLDVRPGQIDPRGGEAAYRALVAAANLALDGAAGAIVTAPLHKEALWAAGHHYPGHTELLAELCGVKDVAMMLYLGPGEQVRSPHGLAIVHVTLHMALRDALAALDRASIVAKVRLVADVLGQLGAARPRIGVCALNPHGGENGLFGDEEQRLIAPAVEQSRGEGFDVAGPFPADTLIANARDGQFDGIVAMYHDQGHIAIKLLAMHRAVNVTLGLPIVRTSVAHGTAFDLAWQGRAECMGLVEAARVAARLAAARKTDFSVRSAR